MDKIYTTFDQSNKNQMQLYNISEKIGVKILKIGRVLGPRWAACSLRSVTAVWHRGRWDKADPLTLNSYISISTNKIMHPIH